MSEQLRRAAQQALDALELVQTDVHWELNSPTRKFLRNVEKFVREALAQSKQDPLDIPLEEFLADFSTRVRNAINAGTTKLIWHGDSWIKQPRTVRDLMMYSRGELKKWPGIGKHSLSEIDDALRNIGLQLRWFHDERSRSLLSGQPTVVANPTQRQPLTDEQIDAIVRRNVTITDQNLSGAVYMSMRELEAAHGIEEQP